MKKAGEEHLLRAWYVSDRHCLIALPFGMASVSSVCMLNWLMIEMDTLYLMYDSVVSLFYFYWFAFLIKCVLLLPGEALSMVAWNWLIEAHKRSLFFKHSGIFKADF